MDSFEFLVSFISVFLALSITKFVEAVARLWHERQRVNFFNLYAISGALLLLLQIQYWWGNYEHVTALGDLCFFGYLIYLFPVVIFIMTVETFIPSSLWESTNGEIKLERYYWENNRYFFSLIIALLIFEAIADILIARTGFKSPTLSYEAMLFRVFGIALMTLLVWKNDDKYKKIHFWILIVSGVLLLFFIFTQSLHLEEFN